MHNEAKYKEARKMLCNYIKGLAKEKELDHEEISERTGFTLNHVEKLLNGEYSPNLDNFIRLAEAVDSYFFVIDKEADDELCDTMRNRWNQSSAN